MMKNFRCDYDYYDMDDYFYEGYRNRLIPKKEIDCELDRIIKKEKYTHLFQKFGEKIGEFYEKLVLYVVNDIILKEKNRDYYENVN